VIDERNHVTEDLDVGSQPADDAAVAHDEVSSSAAELAPGPGEGDSSAAHPEASQEPDVAAPQAPPGPGEGDSSATPAAPKSKLKTKSTRTGPIEEAPPEDTEKNWYILKVQSNRENSICDGLRRRIKIAGLEDFFGDIIVPTEEVREFKDGKARIVKRKLYPGYIVVNMVINDDTWFLVRETTGIGDFTGAGGKPTPMLPHEVEKILRLAGKLERPDLKTGPRPLIPYKVGDKVRIEEGNFQNFEGDVSAIDETNGRVTIMIQIFNRTTPVELEHWQVKPL
jgi:transcriptional antiterminator NusG